MTNYKNYPLGRYIDGSPDRPPAAVRVKRRTDGEDGVFIRIGGVRVLLDVENAWAVSQDIADILESEAAA